MKSETIHQQLAHRSIRKFTSQAVSSEQKNVLLDVVNRTATSMGMQSFSIIQVTDPHIKEKLAKICQQDYVAQTTELWIFVMDGYRNAMIAREKQSPTAEPVNMDHFFQGFTDAALAAQNLTNAVESLGMGAVYFGSILNDPSKTIELLELPKYTFPVVGVGFGFPDQQPSLKPRMDMEIKCFENTYQTFDRYVDQIKEYDQQMAQYYDLRNTDKPLDTFSEQVVARTQNSIPTRAAIVNVIQDQGFDLKLKNKHNDITK